MKWISDVMKEKDRKKVSMVTCYDAVFAKMVNRSPVDMILVGDSIAMTVYGFDSTLHATSEMMQRHTEAVRRGAPDKFIVADMPFDSVRRGPLHAFEVAAALLKAGANAVKVEGFGIFAEVIRHLIEAGIPVMGHLGLTPQIVYKLGGFKVQGRDKVSSEQLIADARALEALGVFSLVLECIPEGLAERVTKTLRIPTIGIGAGANCNGQVLVLYDLLGMDTDFKAKFVKEYITLAPLVESALGDYAFEVAESHFPTEEHVYD